MEEARKLFSPVGGCDASSEMIGNTNLAAFASALEAQFEFSPSAGTLYLTRKVTSGTGLNASELRKVLAFVRF